MLSSCVRRTGFLAFVATAFGASLVAWVGIPDALRLQDPADVAAFRRWFTFLAEAQYYNSPRNRPPEITDCSSLLRYAYREALRNHDASWAREAHLPLVPALPSVQRYSFPRTPVGPTLFRVRPGDFHETDRQDGTFASFADAKTLQRLNTSFISRDISRALPGDLLFFRTGGTPAVFHSMIYLGRSQFQPSGDDFVVYHTGQSAANEGELRRKSVRELVNYPEPQWRPIPTNTCFSGVFRWNILRQAS